MSASRDDGIWLFPISSSKYSSFSDWAACPGEDKCVLCGVYHSGWGDSYHSGQGGHNGIDISAAINTEVYAAAPGTIVYAAYNGARGNTIIIEHPIGNGYSYYSYYQHLNSFVKTSGYVSAGTVIGKVGKSGGNYGYHLHFGIVRGASAKGSSALSLEGKGWLIGNGNEGRILNNPSRSNWNGNYAGAPKGGSAVLSPLKTHMGSVTYTFNASQVTIGSFSTPVEPDAINNGKYYIRHNATGKYMDVESAGDANKTNIQLWDFNGTAAQLFTVAFSSETRGGYSIKPDCSSRLVNGYGNNISSGANVCLWDNTNHTSQRWKFKKVSGGYIILNMQNTSCAMDVSGSNIYLNSYNGNSNQIWSLQTMITYNANGGSGAPAAQMKNVGKTLNLSSVVPVRSGYTFKGWSLNSNATMPSFYKGGSYTKDGNVVLYAVWEAVAKCKSGHTYKTTTTKATLTKNGSVAKKCTVCSNVASKTTIKCAKTVKLSDTSYTYNGKAKTPSVIVKDSAGKTISSKYYTVKYSSCRKNVGKYKVTVTFKGNYSGTKALYFTIKPKAASVNKLTAKSKAITVKLNRSLKQSTGYQIQYSTSKKFTNAKTTTVKSYKTTYVTIKGLKAKKTYYVRVRTYKTVGKTKYYSNWSSYKSKKTK